MSTEPVNSYDRIPYTSHPFPQTHPNRLATISNLFGIQAAALENARVLELGCASGGNLAPMADQFPKAQFHGIDYSQRQIEDGLQLIEEAGLTNIKLEHADILEFQPEQEYDFIFTHGVYSWVADEIQDRILQIISQSLSPNGIAYVSYNTFPGWHMRGMIREIMRYRAQGFEDPSEQLNQARGLLSFLTASVKADNNPYGLLLKQELEAIGRADDSYLIHEHLEEINAPLYFHQFAERLSSHNLQYVGEADFGVMSLENFPDHIQAMLKSVAHNRIETEQYMDFLRNRAFRQTIVCRSDVALDNIPNPQRLLGMRVASNAQTETEQIDIRSQDQLEFRRRNSVLKTSEPIVKAALVQLQRAWPASVPFAELAASARSAVAGRPIPVDSESMSDVSLHLARTLLRCFATSMVDLHVSPPAFALEIAEKPATSKLTRTQAKLGSSVTNRRHERVNLDDIQRFIIRQLDGETDRETVLRRTCQAVEQGELVLIQADGTKVEGDQIQKVVSEIVPQVVRSLVSQALLLP